MKFEVQDASFSYKRDKRVIFSEINFELCEKQVLSVLGPNGVGKTTLMKCMLGLLPLKTGRAIIDGKHCDTSSDRSLWKEIGYVPQRKAGNFSFSVLEMVTMGRTAHLGMFAQPGREDKKIVAEALDIVGISHLKDKQCSQISGGELQMALIARALALKPKLLILDEPESNLDFRNQLIVLNLIKKLQEDFGISSILNTHYPSHAMELSDLVLMLNREKPAVCGPVRDVMTEANLRDIFGVQVHIKPVELETKTYYSIIPERIL